MNCRSKEGPIEDVKTERVWEVEGGEGRGGEGGDGDGEVGRMYVVL